MIVFIVEDNSENLLTENGFVSVSKYEYIGAEKKKIKTTKTYFNDFWDVIGDLLMKISIENLKNRSSNKIILFLVPGDYVHEGKHYAWNTISLLIDRAVIQVGGKCILFGHEKYEEYLNVPVCSISINSE